MSSAYNHKKRSHRSFRRHPQGHKRHYISAGAGRRRNGLLQMLRRLFRYGRGGKYGSGE